MHLGNNMGSGRWGDGAVGDGAVGDGAVGIARSLMRPGPCAGAMRPGPCAMPLMSVPNMTAAISHSAFREGDSW